MANLARPLFVYGMPGAIGGASSELRHTVRLSCYPTREASPVSAAIDNMPCDDVAGWRCATAAPELPQALARRKAIYEAMHPETKHGGSGSGRPKEKQSGQNVHSNFAQETAKKTGVSARQVRRDVAIGERLDAQAAEDVANTSVADSKVQLRQLADLPPKQQRTVAKKIKDGKASTVEEPAAIPKAICEALKRETKQHIAGGKASGAVRGGENRTSDKMSFVQNTAKMTGESLRTIERDVAIGENLDERERIATENLHSRCTPRGSNDVALSPPELYTSLFPRICIARLALLPFPRRWPTNCRCQGCNDHYSIGSQLISVGNNKNETLKPDYKESGRSINRVLGSCAARVGSQEASLVDDKDRPNCAVRSTRSGRVDRQTSSTSEAVVVQNGDAMPRKAQQLEAKQ